MNVSLYFVNLDVLLKTDSFFTYVIKRNCSMKNINANMKTLKNLKLFRAAWHLSAIETRGINELDK